MKKLYFAAIGEINLRMSRESALKIKGKIKAALDCAAGLNGSATENWLTAGVAEPIPQLRVVFPSRSAFSTLAR